MSTDFRVLLAEPSSNNQNVYSTTATGAPLHNRKAIAILVGVNNATITADPTSFTMCGLTWTREISQGFDNTTGITNSGRIVVYSTTMDPVTDPTPTVATVDWGVHLTGCTIIVVEAAHQGSGTWLVQKVGGSGLSGKPTTGFPNPITSANNDVVHIIATPRNPAGWTSPDSTWAVVGADVLTPQTDGTATSFANPNTGVHVALKEATTDQTYALSGTGGRWGYVSLELKGGSTRAVDVSYANLEVPNGPATGGAGDQTAVSVGAWADTSAGIDYDAPAAYTMPHKARAIATVFATGCVDPSPVFSGFGVPWTIRNQWAADTLVGATIYVFETDSDALNDVSDTPRFACHADASLGVNVSIVAVTGHDTVAPFVLCERAQSSVVGGIYPDITLSAQAPAGDVIVAFAPAPRNPGAWKPPLGMTQLADTGHVTPQAGMTTAFTTGGGLRFTWQSGGSGGSTEWDTVVYEVHAAPITPPAVQFIVGIWPASTAEFSTLEGWVFAGTAKKFPYFRARQGGMVGALGNVQTNFILSDTIAKAQQGYKVGLQIQPTVGTGGSNRWGIRYVDINAALASANVNDTTKSGSPAELAVSQRLTLGFIYQQLLTMADQINALPNGPHYLQFHSEVDVQHQAPAAQPWCGSVAWITGAQPMAYDALAAEYRTCYKNVRDFLLSRGVNVLWQIILTRPVYATDNSSKGGARNYYPVDMNDVDYVCVDGYSKPRDAGAVHKNSPSELFDNAVTWARSYSKLLWIDEVGCDEDNVSATYKLSWMTAMYDWLAVNYPYLRGVVFNHSNDSAFWFVDSNGPLASDLSLNSPNSGNRSTTAATAVEFAKIANASFTPNASYRASEVSFAQLQTPDAARKAQVSFAQLQAPLSPRSAQLSWAELQVPPIPARAIDVSFAQLQIPTQNFRAEVSFAQLAITSDAPRAAEVSFAQLAVQPGTVNPEGYYVWDQAGRRRRRRRSIPW